MRQGGPQARTLCVLLIRLYVTITHKGNEEARQSKAIVSQPSKLIDKFIRIFACIVVCMHCSCVCLHTHIIIIHTRLVSYDPRRHKCAA